MTTAKLELTIVVDADGSYAIGKDGEEARQDFHDNICDAASDIVGLRTYHLTLTVPLPEPITLTGTVGETGGEVRLTVASEVA